MPTFFQERKARRLCDQAIRALDVEDYPVALRVARKLRDMGYSGCYEYAARCFWDTGRYDRAIRVLEQGVKEVPHAWSLWSWLGQYYSGFGRWSEALAAFSECALSPNGPIATSTFNRATVFIRMDRPAECLRELESIDNWGGGPPVALIENLRAHALNQLGRPSEARSAVGRSLERPYNDPATSSAYAQLARADLLEGRVAPAITNAKKALEYGRNTEEAYSVLREAAGRKDDEAKLFSVMVEGVWPKYESGADFGFFTRYDVIAATEQEALDSIRAVALDIVRDSLSIKEYDVVRNAPDEFLGVVNMRLGYMLFPNDSSD